MVGSTNTEIAKPNMKMFSISEPEFNTNTYMGRFKEF